jgi:hypothetical protein
VSLRARRGRRCRVLAISTPYSGRHNHTRQLPHAGASETLLFFLELERAGDGRASGPGVGGLLPLLVTAPGWRRRRSPGCRWRPGSRRRTCRWRTRRWRSRSVGWLRRTECRAAAGRLQRADGSGIQQTGRGQLPLGPEGLNRIPRLRTNDSGLRHRRADLLYETACKLALRSHHSKEISFRQ